MVLNFGCDLDLSWVESLRVNAAEVERYAQKIPNLYSFKNEYRIAWLLRAVSCIDLTTLGGDDSESNVQSLCQKAVAPLEESLQFVKLSTAAVCVYPNLIKPASIGLNNCGRGDIPIASVATGFPSGQYPLETRLDEIKFAVSSGAKEIDVVINRTLVIKQDWTGLYNEIRRMKECCGEAHLKVILATGEVGRYINVMKASLVAMMAGADFIKTSTGKETVNATLPVGIVMCRAIKEYYRQTGVKVVVAKHVKEKTQMLIQYIGRAGQGQIVSLMIYSVGLKPAGGIRTANQALDWLVMVNEELGKDWLNSRYFRIGASGLLGDIEKDIYFTKHRRYPSNSIFTLA